jgi:hypothetical protein
MRPVRFLETRSSGLNDVPAPGINIFIQFAGFVGFAGCGNWAREQRETVSRTFIPRRFAEHLVASRISFRDVVRLAVLLDRAVVIGGVPLQGIESGHLHLCFDCVDVDCGHRIKARDTSSRE